MTGLLYIRLSPSEAVLNTVSQRLVKIIILNTVVDCDLERLY